MRNFSPQWTTLNVSISSHYFYQLVDILCGRPLPTNTDLVDVRGYRYPTPLPGPLAAAEYKFEKGGFSIVLPSNKVLTLRRMEEERFSNSPPPGSYVIYSSEV